MALHKNPFSIQSTKVLCIRRLEAHHNDFEMVQTFFFCLYNIFCKILEACKLQYYMLCFTSYCFPLYYFCLGLYSNTFDAIKNNYWDVLSNCFSLHSLLSSRAASHHPTSLLCLSFVSSIYCLVYFPCLICYSDTTSLLKGTKMKR